MLLCLDAGLGVLVRRLEGREHGLAPVAQQLPAQRLELLPVALADLVAGDVSAVALVRGPSIIDADAVTIAAAGNLPGAGFYTVNGIEPDGRGAALLKLVRAEGGEITP